MKHPSKKENATARCPDQILQSGPRKPSDLCGPAAVIARIQCAKADRNTDGRPVKLLLHGEPGCGKSAICKLTAEALTPQFITERVSGQQLTADGVREWIDHARYIPTAWIVRIVEEVDLISPQAEALLLQYLDLLPKQTALLCTSNKAMGDLGNRFQSRFQVLEVERPTPDEVAAYLINLWPDDFLEIRDIAAAQNGDVRASLNDLQTYFDEREYA